MNIKEEKILIRKKICGARKNISINKQKEAAENLYKQVTNLPIFQKAKNIALYWPHNSEINTIPILEETISLNKKCYLPTIHPDIENQLLFMPYNKNTILAINKYGIPEPNYIYNYKDAITLEQLSIIFMPLVAFDRYGNRLGMGKGYYDITLSNLKDNTKQPLCIGVAYAMQEVHTVPIDKWDLPLDGIITEKEYIIFNKDKL